MSQGSPSSTAAESAASHAMSRQWLHYFQKNLLQQPSLPWDAAAPLSPVEKAAIAASIQSFQLGESSEGSHLMKVARRHATQTNDPIFVETIKLFIGEEQRHAKLLKRWMQQQEIPLIRQHWSDSLFRKLRRLSNLQVAIGVLLTAEAIATVYYSALANATRSPLLQQLCHQILQDEKAHVRFQAEILGHLRHSYQAWQHKGLIGLHLLFFRITLLAVWIDHRPVFRASGYTFRQYYQDACEAMNQATQIMTTPPQAMPVTSLPISAD